MKNLANKLIVIAIMIISIFFVACDTDYLAEHVSINVQGSYSSSTITDYYGYINSQTNPINTEFNKYKITIEQSKKDKDKEYKYVVDMIVELTNYKVTKMISKTVVNYKAIDSSEWQEISNYSTFLTDGNVYFNGKIGIQKEDLSFETKSFMIKQSRNSQDRNNKSDLLFTNFDTVLKTMEFDYFLGIIDQQLEKNSMAIYKSESSGVKYKFLEGTTPNDIFCVVVFSGNTLNGINFMESNSDGTTTIKNTCNMISYGEDFETPSVENYSTKPINWPSNFYGLFTNDVVVE